MERYNKLLIALRYYLYGKAEDNKDYLMTLKALDFSVRIHTGTRKDKITPEFQHQLEIAHYIRTLPNIMYKPETIAVALLHDICEDYEVEFTEIESKFGEQVSDAVQLLTKEYKGIKKNIDDYFLFMQYDPIASIVKGADRINNQNSMVGVFTDEKINEYIYETETYILPMLRQARKRMPEQEAAYESIKISLTTQNRLIRHFQSNLVQ